jgi:hypothetical protein
MLVKGRGAAMSIADIIPAARALPRGEKFRLVRLLLEDLAGEELLPGVNQGQDFPIYTPEFAPVPPPSSRPFSMAGVPSRSPVSPDRVPEAS